MERTEFSPLPSADFERSPTKDVPFVRRKRYFVGLMMFLGVAVLNLLRSNLAIAMVDMTSAKNETAFNWTPLEKGLLLSCHSYLCILGIVGGYLGDKFGCIYVFGLAILVEGVLTLFSPLTINLGWIFFFILRILEGAAYVMLVGQLYPKFKSQFAPYTLAIGCWLKIFSKWTPVNERFCMVDFSISGYFVGIIFAFPICGVILEKFCWQYTFYFSGAVAIIWYVVWLAFIYETPAEDKYMMKDEKLYIAQNVGVFPEKIDYPWKKILTSKAVWAFVNERFVEAWSLSFAVECLPFYVKDHFNVSISDVGFISSVPHICNLLGLVIGGPIAEILRRRKILPHSKVYTVMITVGQLTSVLLFVVLGFWDNLVGSIFCICLLRFMYGCAESVYIVLPIDLVGEYSNVVHGLGISTQIVGLIMNPIFMSLFVSNHSMSEWCHYFLFLSAFNAWGATIYFFFGSADPEPWTMAGNQTNHSTTVKKKINWEEENAVGNK